MSIVQNLSFDQVKKSINKLREKKGNGKELLAKIDETLIFLHDYIVELYLEKALKYQHWYMEERDKPDNKRDVKRQKNGLKKMEQTVQQALEYTLQNNLNYWESRLCRFMGRVCDYNGEYKKASAYYKKALKTIQNDPESKNGVSPRHLEIQAFLIYSKMMSGSVKQGLEDSKKLYEHFSKSKEGKTLMNKDYTTWAIWRTGIAIRAVSALLANRVKFDKKQALDWLADSERILNPPKSIRVWADFQLRKDEIASLKKKLQLN